MGLYYPLWVASKILKITTIEIQFLMKSANLLLQVYHFYLLGNINIAMNIVELSTEKSVLHRRPAGKKMISTKSYSQRSNDN